jgi:hypothetical protein
MGLLMKAHPTLFEYANSQAVRRELEHIGEAVNVWRLRGECNRHLAHRIALTLTEAICDREALLDIVLSLSRSPTCNRKE